MRVGYPTPVGIYPEGATPEGVRDMVGNIWEWTRSLYRPYPYDATDGRESLEAGASGRRVVRGGSFRGSEYFVRAASRVRHDPVGRGGGLGFRVVVSAFFSGL
jgi:formylglycine-generating enzyme required for sulfatase activity